MFIRLSLFVTLVLGGQSEFPSILPFTLYASIQDRDVCLCKMFFKEIFWIILFFLFINFFGSVNRLPCYLVSLELSILHKHLKQVMDNNYHLEAGSIFLRVKITLILSWANYFVWKMFMILLLFLFLFITVISQVHKKRAYSCTEDNYLQILFVKLFKLFMYMRRCRIVSINEIVFYIF